MGIEEHGRVAREGEEEFVQHGGRACACARARVW